MNLRYAVLARHRVLRNRRFTHVVSTGSLIAVPFWCERFCEVRRAIT